MTPEQIREMLLPLLKDDLYKGRIKIKIQENVKPAVFRDLVGMNENEKIQLEEPTSQVIHEKFMSEILKEKVEDTKEGNEYNGTIQMSIEFNKIFLEVIFINKLAPYLEEISLIH